MLRNFKQSKTLPSRPIAWLPEEDRARGAEPDTSSASPRNRGEMSSSPSAANVRSRACLTANCQPFGSTWQSTIRGTPPRCSTQAPTPTASISRGTTRTRMSEVLRQLGGPRQLLVRHRRRRHDELLGAGCARRRSRDCPSVPQVRHIERLRVCGARCRRADRRDAGRSQAPDASA